MKKIVLTCAVSLFSSLGLAAEVPTGEEVNKVFEFYNNGQGKGPVLLELTPCKKIDRPAPGQKKACVDAISGDVKKGTTAYAFTRWFVPKGDSYELTFEWVLDGKVISSGSSTVEGSFSYGTWKSKTLSKPGTWEIRVKRGDEVIAAQKIVVVE